MSFLHSYLSFLAISSSLVGYSVLAQEQNVQFNQVANLNGNMQLNRLIFPDNSKIETFSQTQRQILVNQNPNPLTANHVVGSTGQPFVQLSPNSMTIATNNASDLVGAQIEMSFTQAMLDQNGVTADNTFVAMLAPDRQSWIVMETLKSVNGTDSTVRMVKLNSIDGEYMAIGRKTPETGNSLSPFGQQTVNITGSGIQEVEFQDGFRMTVKASQPMAISTDVVNGVSSDMITSGSMSVNNYRYLVRSNLAGVAPNLNNMMAVVQLPLNANRVLAMAMKMGAGPASSISLGIAQRGVLQNPGGATGGNLSPQSQRRQNNETDLAPPQNGTDTAPPQNGTATDPPASPTTSAPADPASAQPQPATDPNANTGNNNGGNNNNNGQLQNPAATQLLLAPTFTPITAQTVLDSSTGRIASTVGQLDGEFIVVMTMGGGQQAPAPQPQPGQQPPAQGQPAPAQGQPSTVPAQGQPGQPAAAPAPQPGQPQTPGIAGKRQLAPPAISGGITMTMAELIAMAERQRTMGMLPVSAMMDAFMVQSVAAAQKSKRGPLRERPFYKV